jgi:hypothetical protein
VPWLHGRWPFSFYTLRGNSPPQGTAGCVELIVRFALDLGYDVTHAKDAAAD